MLDVILPIIQTGAVGGMLILVWRAFGKKDKQIQDMIQTQNQERREMYESHTELVREVTEALMGKNHTDEAMSAAVEKLSEELRQMRGGKNETT